MKSFSFFRNLIRRFKHSTIQILLLYRRDVNLYSLLYFPETVIITAKKVIYVSKGIAFIITYVYSVYSKTRKS